MRATEIILELYQTVQTFKAPGKNKFRFKTPNTPKTPNGMVYTISLKRDFDMKHNSRLVISFTTIDPASGKETNGRTNTGNAIPIFRTVQATLLDYLESLPQDQLPDMLEFSADPNDIQRVSLYKAISHSNKIPGYEFKSQEPFGYGGRVDFTMKRTKQVTEGMDLNDPDTFKISKIDGMDTASGKPMWNIVDARGEIVDAYDRRVDAVYYLKQWRQGYKK